MHIEKFIAYYNECKLNLCALCGYDKKEYYKIPKIENIKKEIKELKCKIDKINIIKIINNV